MELSGDMLNINKNQELLTQCIAQMKCSVLQDTMGAKNLHAFKKWLEKFMGKRQSTLLNKNPAAQEVAKLHTGGSWEDIIVVQALLLY